MAISHKHPFRAGYRDMREGTGKAAKRAINRIRRAYDKRIIKDEATN